MNNKTCLLLLFSISATSVLFVWNSPARLQYTLVSETSENSRLREITQCVDREILPHITQRGDYYVLHNYVKAERKFKCDESVTYTTQADYSFLDNVPHLVDKWMGPISVALYAPGSDFFPTIESIAYLRNCKGKHVKEFVTFHIFFPSNHFPKHKYKLPLYEIYEDIYDCSKHSPYYNVNPNSLYKRRNNLTYPINIARNIARQAAATHFVFASDIELYPTPNFIPNFLQMISNHPEYESRKNPRVYALAVFEILETADVPRNKTALQKMVGEKKAFLFHKALCSFCHAIPKDKAWMEAKETQGLNVFTVGKRLKENKVWEAFYVGTRKDPLFDERLSWEGQSNKMTQAYSLCLLNYDYMVLDNAFLIHKPGVKKAKEQINKFSAYVKATNQLVHYKIKPELKMLYGDRDGCYL